MSPEAQAYLTEALDYLQVHSVRREIIDWPTLRRQAMTLAAEAHTPAETYPAIRSALELLGDRHSMFLEPETVQRRREGKLVHLGLQAVHPTGAVGVVYPGSAAAQVGIHAGDRLETLNGRPISTFTHDELYAALQQPKAAMTIAPAGDGIARSLSLEATPFLLTRQPRGRRLTGDLSYLEIPNAVGLDASKPYATRAHQVIRELDQTSTAGWIIDLRTDTGGALYPMLAAIGPIAGEGALVGFVAPREQELAYYREGRAWLEGFEDSAVEVEEWYAIKQPQAPVAVLISQLTASSGEFTALAFRGRARARFFGEPTRGLPTGNSTQELADGAWIALTTALGTDRAGHTYDGPLQPDEPVPIDWARLGTNDDPVLQAAEEWLRAEEGVR